MIYYIYMLRCRDERLYTGITTDMKRRWEEHSGGAKGARFTRADPPVEIMAVWSCEGRSDASKLECAIKKLDRKRKLRLIAEAESISEIFGKETAEKYKRENIQIF